MNHILEKFREFITQIENNSIGIKLSSYSISKLDKTLNGKHDLLFVKDIERRKKNIFNENGVVFPEDKEYLFYLSTYQLRWNRPEQKTREGLLSGGTYINGMIDAFHFDAPFWEYSQNKFKQLEIDHYFDFPENLRWFESPTAHNDAELTPYYGCFKLKQGEFPNEFYFYDCGLLYKLPFRSFEEYFEAQLSCAMVKCWQYFYIQPDIIIQKNRNLPYSS